ncbi:energy transducer TonB [Tenacibaculum amylolyticum]|uniref:energy transducer TonB n=1 Tax=Tenacibaculum amylolyticum TaxID=104269 RepID=UPI003896697F
MVKRILILVGILVCQLQVMSQSNDKETCDTPNSDPALDLNSITKCSVEGKDAKSKQISVEVTSRRRVIRKRDAVTGVNSSSATSNKLAALKKKASLVGSLDLSNEEVVEKVPFNLVEEIPLFSDCESVAIYQQEKCFKTKVVEHIKKNFTYPKEAYDKSIQGRVLVQFVIDKTGAVADLNIRGPYQGELLEKEAERIVRKLPKFKPGKHNGKLVKVKYGVPISFRIPGKKASNVKTAKKVDNTKEQIFRFNEVQNIPTFNNCSSDNSVDCFNSEMSKHIQRYFAYPEEAVDNNIEGKINAYFVIDKNGEVANVRTRGPKGAQLLEAATKKLIERLPKLKPAMKDGKPVNVKYAFPINFKLN